MLNPESKIYFPRNSNHSLDSTLHQSQVRIANWVLICNRSFNCIRSPWNFVLIWACWPTGSDFYITALSQQKVLPLYNDKPKQTEGWQCCQVIFAPIGAAGSVLFRDEVLYHCLLRPDSVFALFASSAAGYLIHKPLHFYIWSHTYMESIQQRISLFCKR